MTDDEKQAIKEMVDKHVSQIGEHVDCIQVFVQKHDDGGGSFTLSYEKGSGNFYSRFGHIVEWVDMQREFQRCEARRRDKDE